MENFLLTNNNINSNISMDQNNKINSKEKNIEKIFENFSGLLFSINENFARVMDITSRLYFF